MTTANSLNILVVGSGGREHAIVQTCLASPRVSKVIAAPGNGGMAGVVTCFPVSAEDVTGLVALAQKETIDFVIVGPEVPLTLGLVDALEAVNIPAYGPRKAGAQLEGSKVFCKDFFARHHIPTAAYASFSEVEPALAYLETHPAPIVIKVSGLAAGKGVIMAETQTEATQAVKSILSEGAFGESGAEIVIEEWLQGEEASIHVITSGNDALILPPSQDHKRIGEGDTGLNTGGMGAYAPAAVVTEEIMEQVRREIIEPTLKGLKADGIDYRGTLYAGIMLTPQGPKMLEYNVRFGDPETQVLLPLIESDLVPILLAAAQGKPLPRPIKIRDASAMVVVLAADGYPQAYDKGAPIHLPEAGAPFTKIVHAGTELNKDGALVTNGGRVLGVSAYADSLREAADRAYALAAQIDFEGKYLRRDIGHRQLRR